MSHDVGGTVRCVLDIYLARRCIGHISPQSVGRISHSGVTKVGHTEAHAPATRGCVPPMQVCL